MTAHPSVTAIGDGALSLAHTLRVGSPSTPATRASSTVLPKVGEGRGWGGQGGHSPEGCSQWGEEPALHSTQTWTWPQVADQTRDTHMAFGGNMGHRHWHRPRHGPLSQNRSEPQCGLRWPLWLVTSGCSSIALESLVLPLFIVHRMFCFFLSHLSTTYLLILVVSQLHCMTLGKAAPMPPAAVISSRIFFMFGMYLIYSTAWVQCGAMIVLYR